MPLTLDVLVSFLRLVTNPTILVQPTPADNVIALVDVLAVWPGVQSPALYSERPIFRQHCLEQRLTANDIPDAWLAATVIQLGEHLFTFDADFNKLRKQTQVTVVSRNSWTRQCC